MLISQIYIFLSRTSPQFCYAPGQDTTKRFIREEE